MVMANRPESIALFFALTSLPAPLVLLGEDPRAWRSSPPLPPGTPLVLSGASEDLAGAALAIGCPPVVLTCNPSPARASPAPGPFLSARAWWDSPPARPGCRNRCTDRWRAPSSMPGSWPRSSSCGPGTASWEPCPCRCSTGWRRTSPGHDPRRRAGPAGAVRSPVGAAPLRLRPIPVLSRDPAHDRRPRPVSDGRAGANGAGVGEGGRRADARSDLRDLPVSLRGAAAPRVRYQRDGHPHGGDRGAGRGTRRWGRAPGPGRANRHRRRAGALGFSGRPGPRVGCDASPHGGIRLPAGPGAAPGAG